MQPEAATLEAFVKRNSHRQYGLVDNASPHFPHARAFLNGVDVSKNCPAANDIAGWVDLYDDPPLVVGNEIRRTRHYGHVVIEVH